MPLMKVSHSLLTFEALLWVAAAVFWMASIIVSSPIASATFFAAVAISSAPRRALAAMAAVRSSMTTVRSRFGSSTSGLNAITMRRDPKPPDWRSWTTR